MSDTAKLVHIPQIFPKGLDQFLSYPAIFTLIVLFQGCFGGMGILQTPRALIDAINIPAARVVFLTCIAYTATSDMETAIAVTVAFLVFLHFLRSPKEKKALKGQYF